jgi:hypothetical protein
MRAFLGVLFDVEILRECMRRNIPDMTFQVRTSTSLYYYIQKSYI